MDNEQQLKERLKQQAEREAQRKTLAREKAVAETFHLSPIQFKQPPHEVLRYMGTITFSNGVPYCSNTGKSLAESLKLHAETNPHAVAASITESWDQGLSTARSKQDFKGNAEKAQFITDHGIEAWEMMPSKPEVPFDPDSPDATWDDYKKLSNSVKSKLCNTHPGLSARLLKKEQDQRNYEMLIGVPQGKKRS